MGLVIVPAFLIALFILVVLIILALKVPRTRWGKLLSLAIVLSPVVWLTWDIPYGYLYSAGDGKDILVDHDRATGHTDMLTLTDIDQTQLWFRHVGNDLQIDVLGTADQIRVKDWFVAGASGADNHIERIRTADGRTLYDSDVDRLVHAMAAFAPLPASQTRWASGQASNGQVLLAVTH